MNETAALIRAGLDRKRWRSADLADVLGVSAVTAWSWATGRLLPADAIRPRLCSTLGIDTAALAEACAEDDRSRRASKE